MWWKMCCYEFSSERLKRYGVEVTYFPYLMSIVLKILIKVIYCSFNYYKKSIVGSFKDPFCPQKRKGNKMSYINKSLMVPKLKESNLQINC